MAACQPAASGWPPDALRGQPALVTGASSGIGRAVALALARAGADVVVNYFSNAEAADAVVAEIRQLSRRALAVQADVAQGDQMQALFAQAISEFGTLHTVICNAGQQPDAPFHGMTLEACDASHYVTGNSLFVDGGMAPYAGFADGG